MQHKIFYPLALICCLLLTACEDGLLEETPDTFESEEQVFTTEAGAESALNGLYYAFGAHDYHGAAFHNLLMPVSGKFWSSQLANRDATSLNTTPSNISLIQLWAQAYRVINEANIIITNLEENGSTLANRDAVLGQAYFLRGLTYFDLVRLFGGVPIRTRPTTIETLDVPRADVEEVYGRLIEDLELSRTMLSDDLPGRPRKSAATAYLAKVYLTRATTEGNPDFFDQARREARAVVEGGEYSLVDDYHSLFELGNENTRESIFELQYGHTGGVRLADFSRIYTPRGSVYALPNVPTFGRVRPNKETFDQHVAVYPEDPRIDATFLYGEYEKDGETRTIYPRRTRGNDGYTALRKYFDPTYNGTTTQRNMILLRYADILLMLAEIENEINGPAVAYTYVNQVLTRARNSGPSAPAAQPANWSNLTQEEFRLRIQRERLFELLGEGHAWFDTRRFGYDYLLETVITPHNEQENFDATKDFFYPDDPKNLLLPIPQTELAGNSAIDVNNQNPGY